MHVRVMGVDDICEGHCVAHCGIAGELVHFRTCFSAIGIRVRDNAHKIVLHKMLATGNIEILRAHRYIRTAVKSRTIH